MNTNIHPALVETRNALANSWRRSAGESVQLVARNGSVRVPASVVVDAETRLNTGQVILDALAFYIDQWGVSVETAKAELVARWHDLMEDPNRPAVNVARIDWVLDVNYLATGDFSE